MTTTPRYKVVVKTTDYGRHTWLAVKDTDADCCLNPNDYIGKVAHDALIAAFRAANPTHKKTPVYRAR